MTSMKTLMLGLSAAALTIGGVACAQAPATDKPRMDPDRVITRAEAQTRATEMFARLDLNKDGKLDKADRELGRQQMREKMFAKLDANGDGSISKAEFMADKGPEGRGPGMDGPPPPPPGDGGPEGPPHVRGGPDKFAGKFGRGGEGRHGGRHHGGPRGGMMMEKMADTNNDGAVSQAEFVAAALKRFDVQDANHDGKVTKEERQSARAAKRAEWQAKRADKKAAN